MLFIGNTFLTKAEVSTHEEIKRVSSATIIFIYDVVVYSTNLFNKAELRFSTGSSPARGMLMICDGEDL